MKLNLFGLFLILTSGLTAQVDFSGSVNLEGYSSSKEELPFWFYSNQQGRVSEETNIDGWINGKLNFNISENTSLEFGGGMFYQDAFEDVIFVDELYVDFQYKWFQIIAGRKQEPEVYNGLSATNENILWSLNARPMPGLQLKTNGPIYLEPHEKFAFEASWNEYLLGSDRYVKNVRLHHKSLYIIYHSLKGWMFKAGIKHFVQWGGESPELGQQPKRFSDYLRIISGSEGDVGANQGDINNALGNHLGSWELYVSKDYRDYTLSLIFNNLFEDGSGSRFANFPDGRYGINIEANNKNKIVNSVLYEFYYTKNQSNNVNRWGADNYLSHKLVYNSGWTYKERIIGAPFFTYNSEINQIINNKFIAHHLGISGQFSSYFHTFPYKILLSYAHNEGTYRSPLNLEGLNEDVLNFYSKWRVLNLPIQADLKLGFEFNSIKEPIFGAGISLSKQF
ncbi:capsule assembly Wzi family protein [uncultured Christiangramia sp.]|uniref:capsule assembly Wzi family protein n=1 Tax=Christiangramia sp. 3-2217-3z TaxID=3417564 RepID=UPI00262D7DCA|nr:capsule assembly Wzi family protein [uncultured Christiangramia sp.]